MEGISIERFYSDGSTRVIVCSSIKDIIDFIQVNHKFYEENKEKILNGDITGVVDYSLEYIDNYINYFNEFGNLCFTNCSGFDSYNFYKDEEYKFYKLALDEKYEENKIKIDIEDLDVLLCKYKVKDLQDLENRLKASNDNWNKLKRFIKRYQGQLSLCEDTKYGVLENVLDKMSELELSENKDGKN